MLTAGSVGGEPGVVRQLGSSHRPASRRNTVSWFAPITTSSPSDVGYTFDGAIFGRIDPVRSRMWPATSYSVMSDSITASTAS